AVQGRGGPEHCGGVLVGRGEDAALDLEAGGRGVWVGKASGCALALQLGELVAIDREVVVEAGGARHALAQQRDQQHAERRRGEEREEEVEHGGLAITRRPKAEEPSGLPRKVPRSAWDDIILVAQQ